MGFFFACGGEDYNSTNNVDTEPPVIKQFKLTTTTPTVNSTITLSIVASDNTQVDGYLITETPDKPSPYDSELPVGSWLFPKPSSYILLNNNYEMKTVYLWVRDSSDNVSESAHLIIDFNDYEPPIIQSISMVKTSISCNTCPYNIILNATDNVGIVRYIVYEENYGRFYDSTIPPTQVNFRLSLSHKGGTATFKVFDKAGNSSFITHNMD